MKRISGILATVSVAGGVSAPASAHGSDQAFVLLMPTGLYSSAGVAVVALTMLLLAALPRLASAKPAARALPPFEPGWTSWIGLASLAVLLWIGVTGPNGPLENLLPLTIWTLVWMILPVVQPVFDIWRRTNPFTAPLAFARHPLLPLPEALGRWPAVVLFVLFALFQLADPAPEDPRRLAVAVGGYWLFTAVACLLFSRDSWLDRGEFLTVFFRALSGLLRGRALVAFPVSTGVFLLSVLAAGSFDGLNRTFVWLSAQGINPLEYPGRSAMAPSTATGLIAAVVLLSLSFWLCMALGRRFARVDMPTRAIFAALAPSILPIALGYHAAHFLTAVLVQVQYLAVALSDPLGQGADLLGLGPHFVTTGFFYDADRVRTIWLAQAAAVVGAHVWAVVMAHGLAVRLVGDERKAVWLQVPLSAFMIAYTVFGLWLLAAPKGG